MSWKVVVILTTGIGYAVVGIYAYFHTVLGVL